MHRCLVGLCHLQLLCPAPPQDGCPPPRTPAWPRITRWPLACPVRQWPLASSHKNRNEVVARANISSCNTMPVHGAYARCLQQCLHRGLHLPVPRFPLHKPSPNTACSPLSTPNWPRNRGNRILYCIPQCIESCFVHTPSSILHAHPVVPSCLTLRCTVPHPAMTS